MCMKVRPVIIVILPVLEMINMIKKSLIILFLVFCAREVSGQPGVEQNNIYRVKYLSSENVYLDAGRISGLSLGRLSHRAEK